MVVREVRKVIYHHDKGISEGSEIVREGWAHRDAAETIGIPKVVDTKHVNMYTKKPYDKFKRP